MARIYQSPARYVQGPHVLKTEIESIQRLGKNILLLCDEIVWQIVGENFYQSLKEFGLKVIRQAFQGESSQDEMQRISQLAQKEHCDLVIGLGGGKTIDVAKAVSNQLKIPVVIAPTTASTDAPTSAISVLYTETGLFDKYLFYQKNPDLVLVDTAVICQAPAKLLIAGIADALATWVEARAIIQARGQTLVGGTATLAAEAIAEKCQKVIFENALAAVSACQQKVTTPAFEAVVEANTLLSGIGFESGGLAAAHAIHNSFSALPGEIQHFSHGEKVAFGTIVQLILENRLSELEKFRTFYQELGLPVCLKDLNLENISAAELLKVGQLATRESETLQQMKANFTPEDIVNAMLATEPNFL